MNIKDFYEKIGEDYEEVFLRLPSEALIVKFVKKFSLDGTYNELKEGIKNGDVHTAFRAAHTLKGLALNFGFNRLAKASSELTEQLRNKDEFPPVISIDPVDEQYNLLIHAISELD